MCADHSKACFPDLARRQEVLVVVHDSRLCWLECWNKVREQRSGGLQGWWWEMKDKRTHGTTDAAVALHWTRLSERRWWVGANACTHAIPGWRSADWPHRHDGWTHGHTHGTRGTLAARKAAQLTRRSQSVRPTLWPRPSTPARSPSLRQTQVFARVQSSASGPARLALAAAARAVCSKSAAGCAERHRLA